MLGVQLVCRLCFSFSKQGHLFVVVCGLTVEASFVAKQALGVWASIVEA